jgi:hypothetical protein
MGNLTAQSEAWAYSLTHAPPSMWERLSTLERFGIFLGVVVLWSLSWWVWRNRDRIKGVTYDQDN